MSDGSGSSDEGGDYMYTENNALETKRFPLHDCCEFDDANALRELIFVPLPGDENSNEEQRDAIDNRSRRSNGSSSDENDSAAAAHAAAIGHSPQPVPTKVVVPGDGSAKASDHDDQEMGAERGVIPQSENGGDPSPMAITPVDEKPPESSGENENGDREAAGKTSDAASKTQRFYSPHNLNERDDDENTPIHIAIHARKLEHVRLLLEAGASVHKKSDGSPPLHTAISMGSLTAHAQFAYDCVVLLQEHGADLASKDESMHTPLYLASVYNLPSLVTYILSTDSGKGSLNLRADRSQGRALHVAAKFDTLSNSQGVAIPVPPGHPVRHHPDGTVPNASHHIAGYPGKQAIPPTESAQKRPSRSVSMASKAAVTEILLGTDGIEVNAINAVGQTPLHVACARGNWIVARLLLACKASPDVADRRGFTPGQLAHKRGMPIPNDLVETLGGPPTAGTVAPPRDLIVDPDSSTLILTHELCVLHRTCAPVRRDAGLDPPPENVRRLQVLVDQDTGILRSVEFSRCAWENETRRAAMVDVLKCHEYSYVEKISQICSSIPDHPSAVAHLDADTTMSRWSFEAALRASGSVCEAVDKVISGDFRNSFCCVRPPGHHAGPRGIVRCASDPEGGSHGFCFLNNVAIGAAYARSMYRNEGIKKIAIIDFDVHHGNGTEEIIRQLVPNVEKSSVRLPFASGEFYTPQFRPWLDETDVQDVFFASAHGFGARGMEDGEIPQGGWFYPASGKTGTSDAIKNPGVVESPNLTDFLLSQTWTRMGEDARTNCCKILNCGLALPGPDAIPGAQRLEMRDTWRQSILPHLRDFDPDLIFISAGFDAHKKDTMNFGYVGMVEDDYEWVTEQLVKIANTCCNGRIVSVLEGGYKIHGGIVSPFARSVASHVRGLVDGGRSRELYDTQDSEWESQFEKHLVEERERKRQQKIEKMRALEAQTRQALYGSSEGGGVEPPTRKRRRNQVDYRSLYEEMKKEGFGEIG